MSALLLSLPHYHRHIVIYVVQIINTILGRMFLLRDLNVTLHIIHSAICYIKYTL